MRFVLLAALLAVFQADAASYWRWAHPSYPIMGVKDVEQPCGRADYLECASYWTGYIEVKPGLRPILRDCVIKHGRKHFEGWTHEERAGFAVDCGDGTMVSIEER